MGILYSRKEQEFYDKCEKTLTQVDRSLAALASTVDSIHEAVELLLKQLVNLDSKSNEMGEKDTALSLTKNLLWSIENSLYNQKIVSLQGLSDFIKMMKDKQENKNVMSKYMSTLDNLEIDKYIANFETNRTRRVSKQQLDISEDDKDSSVDPNVSIDELNLRIKELEKVNEGNEKVRLDCMELRAELTRANEEVQDRDGKIGALKLETDVLKNELEVLRHRIETIPVQLYCQRSGELMSQIEQELLRKLNENLGLYNKSLDVTVCETTSEIRPNSPLLILGICTSRLGTDAANALQGIKTENTALLIVHHKDEHALPTQTSDRVLTGPAFGTLRGIYDLAFISEKGIYVCDLNSNGISSVIDFICRLTIENVSAKITTPIGGSTVVISR